MGMEDRGSSSSRMSPEDLHNRPHVDDVRWGHQARKNDSQAMIALREEVERATSSRRGNMQLLDGQRTRLGVDYASRCAPSSSSCCIVPLLHIPEPATNDDGALKPHQLLNVRANRWGNTSGPPEDSSSRALPRTGHSQEIAIVFASVSQRLCR